jgi:nucleoside-diphosphate-sugar epimerase
MTSLGGIDALKREWPGGRDNARLDFIRGDARERQVVEDTVQGLEAAAHLASRVI